ncbi:hypothetical protein DPMN_153305 [Dreissena polymorpha]|uniref:Uncharacterized protein n=1 Tax=Dreissena polymorpha TaxID=45954 RepID=A0A9D4FM30_DREPO|nr:hypothetical protein DPMN_153305 [Dreissena polymorpha]
MESKRQIIISESLSLGTEMKRAEANITSDALGEGEFYDSHYRHLIAVVIALRKMMQRFEKNDAQVRLCPMLLAKVLNMRSGRC